MSMTGPEMEDAIRVLQRENRVLRLGAVPGASREARDTGGGGGIVGYGLIRSYPVATGEDLDVSVIARNGASYELTANNSTTMKVEPGMEAGFYEFFVWSGTGAEEYPYTLPAAVTRRALPIIRWGPDKIVLFHIKTAALVLGGGIPVTEGRLVAGDGSVSFGITG